MKKRILIFALCFLLAFSFSQAWPMAFPLGASPIGTEVQGCENLRIGVVGASNEVPAGYRKNFDVIITEKCAGAQVFVYATGGQGPVGLRDDLQRLLSDHPNVDMVILDPSVNENFGDVSAYTANVVTLAEKVKNKNPNIKVVVLTNTPFKGYETWNENVQQNVDTFNNNLVLNRLGRTDLIDAAVNTYPLVEVPPGSDVCGYCVDKIHFNTQGQEIIVNAILSTAFGGSPSAAAPVTAQTSTSTGVGNCKSAQRCREIDEVWQKLTAWLAKNRKGQIWDSLKSNWGSFAEKYLKTIQLGEQPMPAPAVTSAPAKTGLCVATTGTPEQRALLDTIAWAEGTYNRYDIVVNGELVNDPNNVYRKEDGKNIFTSYESHPRILIKFRDGECVAGPASACSNAAGRYQFLSGTYDVLKAQGQFQTGFNPKEQDKAALKIIADRGITGDELKSAIGNGNLAPVWDKIAPVWASLPSSATGGKSYHGQGGRSYSSLQENYLSCLQFHRSGGVSSVAPSTQTTPVPSEQPTFSGSAVYKQSGGGWLCPEDAPQPNAGLTEDEQFNGCPPGMVRINDYCIDKYEASLVKMDGQPWSPYCDPKIHNIKVKAVSLANAVPQSNINQLQAKAACENAGKRSCTDAEWSRACQGAEGRTYPYGSTLVAGACNRRDGIPHTVSRLISQHPELFPGLLPPPGGQNAWNTQPYMQHPALNQQSNTLTKTGEKAQCSSTEGIYDLYGNVYEWTADPTGTFRGDYYQFTPRSAGNEGCLNKVTGHDPSYSDYSIGFRCCANLIS